MHVPDSSGIVGGLYVATPTRTIIGRHALNAFAQEILGVLADAGITPRASGTADAALGYTGQLLAAIKICSNKQWQTGVTPVFAETAASSSITPPVNATVLHLGGSYAGNVTLAENDSNYTNRLIIVVNTGTGLLSIGSSSARIRLEPGRMVFFKYDSTRSTNSKWVPAMFPKDTDSVPEGSTNLYWTQARFDSAFTESFGIIFDDAFETDFAELFPSYLAAIFADQSFTGHWMNESNSSLSSEVSIVFKHFNGLVTLQLPYLSFTTGGGTPNIRLGGTGTTDLPNALQIDGHDENTIGIPIQIVVGGVPETGTLRASFDAGKMAVYRASGSPDFPTSTVVKIWGQPVTYIASP